MGRSWAFAIIAALMSTPSSAATDSSVATRLLARINAERSALGTPLLTWDPALAQDAAKYAAVLAATGILEHSPRSSRVGQSEVLWMGTRGTFSPEQMIDKMASEKKYFIPGVFPAVSNTGNAEDVVHYAQLIGRYSQRVGCAIASGHGEDVLVCRFSPPGNVDGQKLP